MSLQAALPASHCTVADQTASVTLQKNETMRSAVARCVMSRLIGSSIQECLGVASDVTKIICARPIPRVRLQTSRSRPKV